MSGRPPIKKFIILAQLAYLITGCFSSARTPVKEGPIAFAVIDSGQHSLADTAALILIDNQKQWLEIWRVAKGMIEPMPSAPEIDFENEMLAAVFMGKKSSGGYRVQITKIDYVKDTLNISIDYFRRAGGTLLPMITSPYQIAKFPRLPGTAGEYKIKSIIDNVNE